MDHLAIMKKSWGLLPKILTGEKLIESRWYLNKYAPWNKIKAGEVVYFKDSGEPVTIKTEVSKVIQFDNLNPLKIKKILRQYGKADGIEKKKIQQFLKRFKNKRYCILVFLKNPQVIKPFKINKSGFGARSAWITVKHINQIKIKT